MYFIKSKDKLSIQQFSVGTKAFRLLRCVPPASPRRSVSDEAIFGLISPRIAGAMLTHWISGIIRDKMGVYDQAFLICTLRALLAVLLMLWVKKAELESAFVRFRTLLTDAKYSTQAQLLERAEDSHL